MKTLLCAVIGVAFVSGSLQAQNPWSDKMFKEGDKPAVLDHDFGYVPHGTHLYHRVAITNVWGVPLQVDVRVGCSCVSVSPESQVLQPNQHSYLDIRMDAGRYFGPRTVSVYVTLSGGNYYSMSTLRMSANSRADVVLNPSELRLGVVAQGQKSTTRTLDVEYAGTLDWRILGTQDAGPLAVTYKELYRRAGQVGYQVSVAVKPDAKAGSLTRTIYLKTNDSTSPHVPILVEAMVQAGLSAAPQVIAFGGVETGHSATKMVIVHGPRAFRILRVDGQQDGLHVAMPSEAKTVQILRVTWKPSKSGKLHRVLTIVTDLEQPSRVTVTAEGTATASLRAASSRK
jgi:hypothetical protein